MATKRRKSLRPRRPLLKTLLKQYAKLGLLKPKSGEGMLAEGRAIAIHANVRSPLRRGSEDLECIHRKGKTTSVARWNGNNVLLCSGCERRRKEGGSMRLTLKAFAEARKALAAGAGR